MNPFLGESHCNLVRNMTFQKLIHFPFLPKEEMRFKKSLIGSFEKKTLTWSKPYLRKLGFVHFRCIFMKMQENACISSENVCIFLGENVCIFIGNARKCVHVKRPLPVRVIFWFLYVFKNIKRHIMTDCSVRNKFWNPSDRTMIFQTGRPFSWFPTWTGKTRKPGKMRKLFPVREKSGNFEQTGKVREFYPKYWKNERILPKLLEKWGKI